MARKKNIALTDFQGEEGQERLKSTLLRNKLIKNSHEIASNIINNNDLVEYSKNDLVIECNAADDFVYFILVGEVEIKINNKVIDKKSSPEHVGELAASRAGLIRTADVIVKSDKLICARVTGAHFRKIKDKFPEFKDNLGYYHESSYLKKIGQFNEWGKEEFSWYGISTIPAVLVAFSFGTLAWQNDFEDMTIALSALISGAATFIFLILSNPKFAYRRTSQILSLSVVTLIFYKLTSIVFNLKELSLPFSIDINIAGDLNVSEFIVSLISLVILAIASAHYDNKLQHK